MADSTDEFAEFADAPASAPATAAPADEYAEFADASSAGAATEKKPGVYDTIKNNPDADVGVVEAGGHYLSGAIAPFAGGLTYLGTLAATGGDTDAAESVRKDTENALTFEPRTKAGKDIVNDVDEKVSKVAKPVGEAADAVADRADRLHGPAAGAFVKTAIKGAPYVLGLGGELGAGRAVADEAAGLTNDIKAAALKPTPAFAAEQPPSDLAAAQPAPAAPPSVAAASTGKPVYQWQNPERDAESSEQWYTTDKGEADDMAKRTGGTVAQAKFTPKNPLVVDTGETDPIDYADGTDHDDVRKARAAGNDAVIYRNNAGKEAHAVLDKSAVSGAAAAPEAAPVPPTAQPAQHTVGAAAEAPPKFEEAPPEEVGEPKPSAALSDDERTARVNTLRELGLDEVPESVLSGDRKAASTDYSQSQLDNPGGNELAGVFTKMRKALDSYSDRLVTRAGGSSDLDGTALENRGATITKPLQGLSDLYDAGIKKLYAAADARASGVPLDLNSTAQVLAKRSNFVGTTDGRQLLDGLNTHLDENGLLGKNGELNKATVQQGEQIKQYLNDQWTPRTARLIKNLKDAIDDDVTKSAGEDIYGAARSLRRQRAVLLDDPKGIASLLDNSGPENINRSVPLEKIPDKLMSLPNEQFGHIVNTLEKARAMPELAESATAAINEIRSHMMARMQQTAQKFKDETWNNRGVSQFLNANNAKLARVFTPEELRQIDVLNRAGNILDVNRSYKGAAVQSHNLAVRAALGAIKHSTGALGAAVAGPFGATAGEIVGNRITGALDNSMSKRAARKRITNLADD